MLSIERQQRQNDTKADKIEKNRKKDSKHIRQTIDKEPPILSNIYAFGEMKIILLQNSIILANIRRYSIVTIWF